MADGIVTHDGLAFDKFSEALKRGQLTYVVTDSADPSKVKKEVWAPNFDQFFVLAKHGAVIPFRMLDPRGKLLALDSNVIENKRKMNDFVIPNFDKKGTTISVATTAIEGNKRRNMNLDEFGHWVKKVDSALRSYFKQAEIRTIENLPDFHKKAVNLFGDVVAEERFIMAVGNLLNSNEPKRPLEDKLVKLSELAEQNNIQKGELASLVALQIAVEGDQPGEFQIPGRKVLKPNRNMSAADAYNVISDLRFLKSIALLDLLQVDQVLLTSDKHLALFWSGLLVKSCVNNQGVCELTTEFKFSISGSEVPMMYPGLTRENFRRYFGNPG